MFNIFKLIRPFQDIIKFVFFNSALPIVDILTDIRAFILYRLVYDHPNWANITLFWIWVPFILHLSWFLYHFVAKTGEADLKRLGLHIPFVLPLRNLYLAFRLYQMKFGMEDFDNRDWKAVEEILAQAARAGRSESYFGSGPQGVTQLVIALSVGHFDRQIMTGTVVSILSLTWGASRAYFMERSKDEADPDPALPMVALRVFPWMLLVVANSLLMWIAIGGMIGLWFFPAVYINFVTIYVLIRSFIDEDFKVEGRRGKERFLLKSALTSLWLPSVVGDHPKMFIVSAVCNLVTKILILIVALTYAFLGAQQHIQPHPFIFWCEENWRDEKITTRTFSGAFDSTEVFLQKVRRCGSSEEETTIRWSILVILLLSNCASLGASLWLNRIKNYVNLFKATRNLLGCIPTTPIIHRSAIFSLVKSTDDYDNEVFEEMMAVEDISGFVSRPNSDGETPLHIASACKETSWKALLLWRAGAKPLKNCRGEVPAQNYLTQMYSQLDVATLGLVEKARLKHFLRDWVGAAEEDKEKAEEQIKDLFDSNVQMICLPTDRMDQREKSVSAIPSDSIALQALPVCVALGPKWAGWKLRGTGDESLTREEDEMALFQQQEWLAAEEKRAQLEEYVRERGRRAMRAEEQTRKNTIINLPYSVRFAK